MNYSLIAFTVLVHVWYPASHDVPRFPQIIYGFKVGISRANLHILSFVILNILF